VYRRRRVLKWLPLSGAEPDLAPGIEATVIDRLDIQATLDALPPKYRVPLVLYTYEEYSVTQIAEMLGLSTSAVKMRLSRARDKFRQAYGQEKSQ
jgi:RNA polymerase sigma factor (sigma-70 family)